MSNYDTCKACGNELDQEESYIGVCENCQKMYNEQTAELAIAELAHWQHAPAWPRDSARDGLD